MTEQGFNTSEYSADVVSTCPNCGSVLVFSPEDGCLKCRSCGYMPESGEAVFAGHENDLESLLENLKLNEDNETLTVHCPTCGAESQFDENVVADCCKFCKNPIVASSRSCRTLRPQGIVPFAITRDQAAQKFKSWVHGLWFAPNSIKNVSLHETMKGFYCPIWTFDFNTVTRYTGERGEHYYVTETRRRNGKDETVRVQKTRWHYASGVVENNFDDVVAYASSKLDKKLQDQVGPWHIKNPREYSEDIVRGFTEQNYDLHLADGLDVAKETAKSEISSSVRRDIGGDEQRIHTMNTNYFNLTYKLLLIPFWQSMYRHGGKDFRFIVNGETGKASGNRPYSGWKIFFLVSVLLIIAAVIIAVCMNS